MSSLSVSLDQDQLLRVERMLRSIPGAARKAEISAIKKTTSTLRVRIRRSLVKELPETKQKELDRFIHAKLHADEIVHGVIAIHNHKLGAERFGAIKTASGLTGTVFGESRDFPHAFLARPRGGTKRLAFVREGESRLPIKRVYAGTLGELWERSPGHEVDLRDARELLLKNIDSQLPRFLDRKK